MERIFSKYDNESYKHRFIAELEVGILVGGIPSDPKVAEGWLRSKLQDTDERIREEVAKVMVERQVDADEAAQIVNDLKNLNGFKHTPEGQLFIEGRQVKAAIKEATSVAVAAKKIDMTGWGATRKWLTNFLPEHVFILEETIPLFQLDEVGEVYTPVFKPTGILQQFVHTRHGSSIQYQEFVEKALVRFTVISDHEFTTRDWAMLWTTGEYQGVGASRSQGYGKYGVVRWDKIEEPGGIKPKAVKKPAAVTDN